MENEENEIDEIMNGYKITCMYCGLMWYSEIKIPYCPECNSKDLKDKTVKLGIIREAD